MTSGMLVYRGPSVLDGAPLLVAVTRNSQNRKTGPMSQAWVLRSDVAPNDAIRDGRDASICGSCLHRTGTADGRSCYVVVHQGPRNVWRQFVAGNYPLHTPAAAALELAGDQVRVSAYGDPAAVPFDLWQQLLARASGWVGYTSLWKSCDPRFRALLMASVASPADIAEAQRRGWRTYRARTADEALEPGEIVCPASDEAGHRLTCLDCNLCRGAARDGAKSIAIIVHGRRASKFEARRDAAFIESPMIAIAVSVASADVDAFEEAVQILSTNEPTNPVGRQWRLRALEHLCRAFDGSFRAGPTITNEGQALALIKGAAADLRAAGDALDSAARALKDKGAGLMATTTHQASKRAHDAAEGLYPSH